MATEQRRHRRTTALVKSVEPGVKIMFFAARSKAVSSVSSFVFDARSNRFEKDLDRQGGDEEHDSTPPCFEQGCFLTRSAGTEAMSQHAES